MNTEQKIAHQQTVVKDVLIKLKMNIDEDAIVAGGAPRNWMLGLPANDIDLYLRSHVNNTTVRTKHQLENALGCELEFTKSHEVSNYKFGMDIEIVRLVSFYYQEVLFQVIVCNPNREYKNFKMDIVNHMDIGINRVWIDWYNKHDVQIKRTSEFDKDIANKALTLYPGCMTETQLSHCMKNHLPKMQKYFPNYRLVIEN